LPHYRKNHGATWKKPHRCRLFSLATVFLLGFLTNSVVLSLLVNHDPREGSPLANFMTNRHDWKYDDISDVTWFVERGAGVRTFCAMRGSGIAINGFGGNDIAEAGATARCPNYISIDKDVIASGCSSTEWQWYRHSMYGWPWTSLSSSIVNDAKGAHKVSVVEVGGNKSIRIPTGLSFGGLCANSLVFAVVYLILFRSVGVVKRAHRRRGGCCLKCGYDLKFAYEYGCSECGWRRESYEEGESSPH
jgi:hypothetical protein